MNLKYVIMFLEQRIQLLTVMRELETFNNRSATGENYQLSEAKYILSAVRSFAKDD